MDEFKGRRRPYCYDVSDAMDGYTIHSLECGRESFWGVSGTCKTPFDPNNREHTRYAGFQCTCGHPGAGCYCR